MQEKKTHGEILSYFKNYSKLWNCLEYCLLLSRIILVNFLINNTLSELIKPYQIYQDFRWMLLNYEDFSKNSFD